MKPGENIITEQMKALAAENQIDATPSRKIFIEFALNDYPDTFERVMQFAKVQGIEPGEFFNGYLRAVAMNIVSIAPNNGAERLVAKMIGNMLTDHLTQLYLDPEMKAIRK